jgi:hypothetical protein
MSDLGDTKECPMCGGKATLMENTSPSEQGIGRAAGGPVPSPTTRVRIWRCENDACDYDEVDPQ